MLGVIGAAGLGSVVNDALRVQDFGTLSGVLMLMVLFLAIFETLEKLVSKKSRP